MYTFQCSQSMALDQGIFLPCLYVSYLFPFILPRKIKISSSTGKIIIMLKCDLI